MPQSAIARLERGRTRPRVDTLMRLLAECGYELELRPRLGDGIDRTGIRRLLALTPADRVARAIDEARNLNRLLDARR
jgi:transcriptional regulator with XRE-family HTH domain